MEKPDYKHGTFTLASTDVDSIYDDCYDEYRDFCNEMGIKPNHDGYWKWCHQIMEDNWDSDLYNIKTCKEYNVPVAISGNLGLWWGQVGIDRDRYESVIEAIKRITGYGYDTVEIMWVDGVIEVHGYHHDGCNTFYIKALSKKGEAKQYADFKPWDFKRLPYLYAIGI